MKMTLDEWEKFSKTILSIVSTFAIIVGGIFVLVEYYGHKIDREKSESLNLVSEYHSDNLLKYREKLDKAWEKNHSLYNESLSNNTDKAEAYYDFVTNMIETEGISTDINNILYFYERIVTCVNTGLCDKKIIDDFFLIKGNLFFIENYPYICALRERWEDDKIWYQIESYFVPDKAGKICT